MATGEGRGVSNRPFTKAPKRSLHADRVSALSTAINDLPIAEKNVGMREAFQRALDLVKARGAAAAAEIESLLHEVPR